MKTLSAQGLPYSPRCNFRPSELPVLRDQYPRAPQPWPSRCVFSSVILLFLFSLFWSDGVLVCYFKFFARLLSIVFTCFAWCLFVMPVLPRESVTVYVLFF